MRTAAWALVLVAPGLVGGCSGDDDERLNLVNGCDITQARCQRAIFELTGETRGEAGAPMPAVRIITVEQFEDWLESVDAPSSNGAAEVWDGALQILRFLPEGSSVAEESSAVVASGVAAFYEPRTKQITVIDRGANASRDPRDDLLTLSHEFVHALQDQELNLIAFQQAWVSSFDSRVAVGSLIEGEATVLGFATLARAIGRPPAALNWSAIQQALRDGFFETATASAAPLLGASLTAPYALGTAQLASLWLREGQRAIEAVYPTPPLSVLDWADDTSVTSASRLEPLDCFPTAGPPGFTAYGADSLGPLGLFAVALQRGDAAETASLDLRADSLVAFAEPSVPGSYAVAWRIRFESTAAATRFQSRLSHALPEGAAIAVQNREAVYYGTTHPDRLTLWTNATHCGTRAELPAPREPADIAESTFRRCGFALIKSSPRARG